MVVVGVCGNAGCMLMWWQTICNLPKAGFLAPVHQRPLTAMLLFSSDVQQYMICKSSCAHGFATMHHTHTRTHTHTHTHTCTCTCITTSQNWLQGPHLGGEPAVGNKTPLATKTPASPVAWLPRCSRGTHLWAYKTHEMREVGYGLE